jgi:DHA3 family macrolide efflux protein-like MFS transporter
VGTPTDGRVADPAHPPNSPDTRRTVLKNRDFLFIWLGQLVSQLGDRMHSIALVWWVLQKTGSAALMGTVLIASSIPAVLLGPIAGSYVDRWNRKAIIVGMDLARGAIVSWIAFLAIRGTLEVWQLLVATAAMAIGSIFFGPAVSATIPNLVRRDEITRANSLSQMVAQGSGILGPAVGGVLVAVLGVGGVFLLNGVSFIISGIAALFVAVPPTERADGERKHILSDLKEGFLFVKGLPTVFGILKVVGVLNFFTAPFAILLPIVVRNVLHRGADALGFLETAISVGFLAASGILASVKEIRRKHPLIIWGIAAGGVCLGLMGVIMTYPGYLVLMGAIGILIGISNILMISYSQSVVPDRMRGRVFGLMTTLSGGLQPVAFGIVGLVADVIPISAVFLVSGVALAVGGLYLYMVPGMREV